jgi:drug/metabolite transporter (DMT)-like permease
MNGGNVYISMFYRSLFTFPILLLISIFISSPKIYVIYFSFNIISFYLIFSVILIIVGDALFMIALQEFKVNLVMPIAAIYPLVATFILIATNTEKITNFVFIGTFFIILGVITVTRYGGNGTGNERVSSKVIALSLGAAVCWGTSVVLVRIILAVEGSDPVSLTGVRVFLIGLIAIIIFLFQKSSGNIKTDIRNKSEKNHSFLVLGISGLVGWVIGSTVFFFAVQNIGASIPTPISSLNPIIAVLIGYYLKLEKINRNQFIGVLFSVLGTIIIVI